ncbi:hypothetical protein CO540_29320 [Micromonospora sp. WMMA2032]|uniref:hypothetical protein n=1 Tax=Micromonospora sp. WMMA2032 TaxID=2039870 RepID=UPI000C059657|nr:hypothetical protein [Micromonospora sp. WMMA2032]ATO17429.1 hypothetical protein CO540_29320 [Micromonospora sp. WMMA2032]
MGNSFWETQFILDPPAAPVERHGDVDLHLPAGDGPHPGVVVVHGVPGPPEAPDARDWPLYRGYGALLADRGAVVAIPRLAVASPDDLTTVATRVVDAAALLRADPRVDSDRLAVWFFSGAGLLLGDWLRDPPRWLRGLAATYPLLAPLPEWPPIDRRFHPLDALTPPTPTPPAADAIGPAGAVGAAGTGSAGVVSAAGASPTLVLTRVGRDRPEVASTVAAFTAAAERQGWPMRVVDVPNGRHGFDALDHTEESRTAVRSARDALLDLLT